MLAPLINRHQRRLRFLAIGGFCFVLQYVLLRAFVQAGMKPAWACNALAFIASTQVNCALSQTITWADRRDSESTSFWWSFVPYNGVALASLVLNTAGFWYVYHMFGILWAAQVAGGCLGMAFTYRICNLTLFREGGAKMVTATGAAPAEPGAIVLDGQRPTRKLPPERRELRVKHLGLDRSRPVGSQPGVAVVMPAKNEMLNLRETVAGVLAAYDAAGVGCTIVIASDGGSDGTPFLAYLLSQEYPGRVVVAQHEDQYGEPFNQGYATAMESGLALALMTGHEYIVSTDADGQFDPKDMVGAHAYAMVERKEAVFGYREHRADSFKRRIVGKAWTMFTRLWTHVWVHDADCAIKVFWAGSVAEFKLVGRYGMAGAELVAWARARHLNIGQYPVQHLQREDVQNQTGGSLKVILGSFGSLPVVYSNLVRSGHRWGRARRLVRPADVAAYAVTVVAALMSVASLVWYIRQGGPTLAYPDAVAHSVISRQVVAGATPGLAQLGTVWPPLPHMLALWGVWLDELYYSGLAGSVISMLAYVVTARYLYKLGERLTERRLCGLVAAALFMFNPNVLYMQSTPMTELLLLACLSVSAYYLTLWSQTRDWRHLAAASIGSLLGCTTRYEAWVYMVAMLAVITYVELRHAYAGRFRNRKRRLLVRTAPVAVLAGIGLTMQEIVDVGSDPGKISWALFAGAAVFVILPLWRERRNLQPLKTSLVLFSFVGAIAIPGWMAWGWIISGNPLEFYSGSYAKTSLWVGAGEKAVGDLGVSAYTYWIAMVENLTVPVVVAMGAGFVFYIVSTRLRPETVAPMTLMVFVPFFVYSLYSGQRPLHVRQVSGDLYNLRFGLVMVLAAAVFVAYLTSAVIQLVQRGARIPRSASAGVVIAALALLAVTSGRPVTLTEGVNFRSSETEHANLAVARWLQANYDGGTMLMEGFSNATVTFDSRVPSRKIIYEGNNEGNLWQQALLYPRETGVRWIFMRNRPQQDTVWQALRTSQELKAYGLAYRGPDQLVFRLGYKGSAQTASSTQTPQRPAVAKAAPTMAAPVEGYALWSSYPGGQCVSGQAPAGTRLLITNPTNRKKATCLVTRHDPHSRLLIWLSVGEYKKLAPTEQGLVAVKIQSVPANGRTDLQGSPVRPAATPRPVRTSASTRVKERALAVSKGLASWYKGPAGRCASRTAPIGSRIRVVNPATNAAVTCKVLWRGPGIEGRIVNLAQADFARLAPTDQGILNVQVNPP